MLRTNSKLFYSLILILLLISLSGCAKKDLSISINQDTFHSQNASAKDNQSIASKDILPGDNITTDTPLSDGLTEGNNTVEAEETVEEVFETVNETVYATEYVRIRSHYSTKDNNVVTILEPGGAIKRIGIGKEWSKVEFDNGICYIMSEYLTLQAPTATVTPSPTMAPETASAKSPETAPTTIDTPLPSPTSKVSEDEDKDETSSGEYSFVETLTSLHNTDRLICVIGTGASDCTVSYHKKDRNGDWVQIFSVDGDCGSQGITYQKREGDNKTPAGLYSFTLAFGLKTDPGAFLNYRKITENDYWIDDINSPYYNTWVNSSDTPGDYTSEKLIEHDISYNYALNINYNPDCTPGLGSAVFLHCYNGSGSTTGCIAIPEKNMKTLVKEVDSSTHILIVPKEEDLSTYK